MWDQKCYFLSLRFRNEGRNIRDLCKDLEKLQKLGLISENYRRGKFQFYLNKNFLGWMQLDGKNGVDM